jgi:hypothetical protein
MPWRNGAIDLATGEIIRSSIWKASAGPKNVVAR